MADFGSAYRKLECYEGGYVLDKEDPGGETFRGISRRNYPAWEGWETIDRLKSGSDFPDCLRTDSCLQTLLIRFYRQQYWDRFHGDKISHQGVAEELLEAGVNMGLAQAVRFFQAARNLLNGQGTSYGTLVEDGHFGARTLEALNNCLDQGQSGYLLKIVNVFQGMHYISLVRRNPAFGKFLRGWLNRVRCDTTDCRDRSEEKDGNREA